MIFITLKLNLKMNCSNFKSNCEIYIGCCKEYICCYLCHSNNDTHKYSYTKQVKHIKCKKCDYVLNKKDFSNKCPNCDIIFNKNYCDKCLLWHNFENYFHCDDCNYCLIGKKEDYTHCKKCNICINNIKLKYHKCNLINAKNDCYLCLEDLYETRHNNRIFKCGHTVHKECYNDLYKANKNNDNIYCGLCRENIFFK